MAAIGARLFQIFRFYLGLFTIDFGSMLVERQLFDKGWFRYMFRALTWLIMLGGVYYLHLNMMTIIHINTSNYEAIRASKNIVHFLVLVYTGWNPYFMVGLMCFTLFAMMIIYF